MKTQQVSQQRFTHVIVIKTSSKEFMRVWVTSVKLTQKEMFASSERINTRFFLNIRKSFLYIKEEYLIMTI